jgi:hypothetical protein
MSTTKQNSIMKNMLISNDKYASNSKEQLEFLIALTALNMISRTRISQDLKPKKTAKIVKNVQDMLTHVPAVSLSCDLWMTRRAEDFFPQMVTISLVLVKPTHILVCRGQKEEQMDKVSQ